MSLSDSFNKKGMLNRSSINWIYKNVFGAIEKNYKMACFPGWDGQAIFFVRSSPDIIILS